MPNLTGEIILNRYRVDDLIGRGGMAEVYKVWDSKRMTFLAMKVLHEDLALDRVFMRRFQREAQTLSKLQHPNIVRFYGLEQDGRLAFMLLDFVEGETLKHKIFDAGGPMPADQIRGVVRTICGALQFAHGEGLVHCDIKPGNIMIDQNGKVLLSDFGIARMSDTATATMVGMGTPAYMAPEQARGLDPVPQTDIYALGVVLFEMLTGGERPFTGERAETTGGTSEKVRWEQIHLQAPSPCKWNPDIPLELEAVVQKCLQKDVDDRYESPLEIINALELAIVDEQQGSEQPDHQEFVPPVESIPSDTCPGCSAIIQPDWQLCPKCGIKLPVESTQPSDTPDVKLLKQSTKKRVPKGIIVLGGIFAILIIAVASVYVYFGFHRTNQAARLAPDDAISSITFSPGPIQLYQLLNVQNLVDAAPIFAAIPGVPELLFAVQDDFDIRLQIDPVSDILPWIGRETSLIFLPENYRLSDAYATYAGLPFIVTVASRNDTASSEFMDSVVDQLENQDYVFNTSTYQGYTLTEVTTQHIIPLAFANLENMLVVASDISLLQDTIDRSQGNNPDVLFEDSEFKHLLDKLPGNRLGYIYINWPLLIKKHQLETNDFLYADQWLSGDSVGAAIKLNPEGLLLEFLLNCDQDALTALQYDEMRLSFTSNKLLDYSPDNTLLFVSGKDLSMIWETLTMSSFWKANVDINQLAMDNLDWNNTKLESMDDFIGKLEGHTGVHLVNDLLDYNSKEFAIMVVSDLDGLYGNKNLPFGLLFAARMDNPELGFEQFQKFIKASFQYREVEHYRESIDGINVWFVEQEANGVMMVYAYWDDIFLLGTSKNMIRAALGNETPHLSNSQIYQATTGLFSAEKNKLIFVNLEDILRYIRDANAESFPQEIKQYLDPIRAIGIIFEPISQDGWLYGAISIHTQ